MDILSFVVLNQTFGSRRRLSNLLQTLQNADELLGRENSGVSECTGVGGAGRQFVTQEPAIEVKRSLPALEPRV
jgi:hypothetical protein